MGSPSYMNRSVSSKVLTIADLSEGVVNKSSILEGVLLNRYGTYDRMQSSANLSQTVKHYIINADLTDRKGLATVTVSCYGEAICSMFKDVLMPGKTVRLSGFSMKVRSDGKEHGDIPKSVRLHTDSSAHVIPNFDPAVVLKFCSSDKISNFINRKEDKVYLHPSLSVTVFDIFPEREDVLTVKIADGTSDTDIFVLEMDPDQKNLYDSLCEKVKNNSTPTLFLKNVLLNTFGQNHSFRIDKSTIVAEVQGERTKRHLDSVFRTLCVSRAVHREVSGTLYVRNPAAPAFRKLCGNCKLQNYMKQEDGTVYCYSCQGIFNFIRIPRLECEIKSYDSSTILCYALDEEVRAIINHDPEDFLDVDEYKKNEVLSHVEFDGLFKINSVNQLCGVVTTYQTRSDIAGLLSPQREDVLANADAVAGIDQVPNNTPVDDDVFVDLVNNGGTAYENGAASSGSVPWEEDIEIGKSSSVSEGNERPQKLPIKGGKGKRKLSRLDEL